MTANKRRGALVLLAAAALAIGVVGLVVWRTGEPDPKGSSTVAPQPVVPDGRTASCSDDSGDLEGIDDFPLAPGENPLYVDIRKVTLRTDAGNLIVRFDLLAPLEPSATLSTGWEVRITDPTLASGGTLWYLDINLDPQTDSPVGSTLLLSPSGETGGNTYPPEVDGKRITMSVPLADLNEVALLPPTFSWEATGSTVTAVDGLPVTLSDACGGDWQAPTEHLFPDDRVPPSRSTADRDTGWNDPTTTAIDTTTLSQPDYSENRAAGPQASIDGVPTRITATGFEGVTPHLTRPNTIQVEQRDDSDWSAVALIEVEGLGAVDAANITAVDVTGDGEVDFIVTSISTTTMSTVISSHDGTWRAVEFAASEGTSPLVEYLEFSDGVLYSRPRSCNPDCATGGRDSIPFTYSDRAFVRASD